jgi:hypothetical protein
MENNLKNLANFHQMVIYLFPQMTAPKKKFLVFLVTKFQGKNNSPHSI